MPVTITDCSLAAAALREGRLVAFATETVYGLGAAAANRQAVGALYQCKRRPRNHPVIVHLSDFSLATRWVRMIPAAAHRLAEAFMPGPLTLLLPAADGTEHLTGGSDSLAIRVPAHPSARELLRCFGDGVAAPSANRFGHLSPTSAAHVMAEFQEYPELLILDGGECEVGVESTIVGFVDGQFFVARPGVITAADLSSVLSTPALPLPEKTRAPGLLERHYAPRTPLFLAESAAVAEIDCPRTGVLSRHRPAAVREALWRPAAVDVRRYSQTLYAHLRALDAVGAVRLVVEKPPDGEEWEAVNDRLRRASGGRG